MPDDLYRDDILTWSEQQSARLRRLRAGERVNDFDWDNLIEEIEALGRSEVAAVESPLLQAVLHLMKRRAWPRSGAGRKWLADADDVLKQAQAGYRPSMARLLDLRRVHAEALRRIPHRRFVEPAAPVPTQGVIPLVARADRNSSLEALEAALFPPADHPPQAATAARMWSGTGASTHRSSSSGSAIARASRCSPPACPPPYIASPRIGKPSVAQCTRSWCVRPVSGRNSSQAKPAPRPSTRQAVRAGSPAACASIRQPPAAVLVLRSRASVTPASAAGAPRTTAQ